MNYDKDMDDILAIMTTDNYYVNPEEAKQALIELVANKNKSVDRFEVIDDTGRAYVKGSIYGSPVSVELSYQDDDRTLKVFVTELTKEKSNE